MQKLLSVAMSVRLLCSIADLGHSPSLQPTILSDFAVVQRSRLRQVLAMAERCSERMTARQHILAVYVYPQPILGSH